MAKLVDLELKKAFADLHVKMVETRKKIHFINAQIEAYDKVLKFIQSTRRELNVLTNDTKTYIPVSRMFLQTDLGELKENIDNRVSILHNRITELEDNKLYLDSKLKESEHNLREMVQQRKDQIEDKAN